MSMKITGDVIGDVLLTACGDALLQVEHFR